jgi:hypothetical protein
MASEMRLFHLLLTISLAAHHGSANRISSRQQLSSHRCDADGVCVLPQLFMDTQDALDHWGLLVPTPGRLSAGSSVAARRPPPLYYDAGAEVLAILPALDRNGRALRPATWEVFAANTTGWEPLAAEETAGRGSENACGNTSLPGVGTSYAHCAVTLLRYETKDFTDYTEPAAVMGYPPGYTHAGDDAFGTPTLKSMARDDARGLYVLFAFGAKEKHAGVPKRYRGPATWTSTDRGMSWAQVMRSHALHAHLMLMPEISCSCP